VTRATNAAYEHYNGDTVLTVVTKGASFKSAERAHRAANDFPGNPEGVSVSVMRSHTITMNVPIGGHTIRPSAWQTTP
jgi:hypothetical protein